jgi:hypothetical protein
VDERPHQTALRGQIDAQVATRVKRAATPPSVFATFGLARDVKGRMTAQEADIVGGPADRAPQPRRSPLEQLVALRILTGALLGDDRRTQNTSRSRPTSILRNRRMSPARVRVSGRELVTGLDHLRLVDSPRLGERCRIARIGP